MNDSKEFALYIDHLRKSRNISREDFVKDIVSMRQYYRFISGESSLKNETINSLMEKLEITSLVAYGSFIRQESQVFKELSDVYVLVQGFKFIQARNLFKSIDHSSVISFQHKKFYEFLEIVIDDHFNKTPKEIQVKKIEKMIDYPNVLNKGILTFIETNCLFYISDYLIRERKDFRVAEHTYKMLTDYDKRYIGQMTNSLATFYSTCARNLGQIGEYEKALFIANEGIKVAKKYGFLNGFTNLLYYKALAERDLEIDNNTSLIRLFSFLISQDDEEKSKTYSKLIKQHFNITQQDIIDYKQKK